MTKRDKERLRKLVINHNICHDKHIIAKVKLDEFIFKKFGCCMSFFDVEITQDTLDMLNLKRLDEYVLFLEKIKKENKDKIRNPYVNRRFKL